MLHRNMFNMYALVQPPEFYRRAHIGAVSESRPGLVKSFKQVFHSLSGYVSARFALLIQLT